MPEPLSIECGIINKANRGESVKETVDIIHNMGPFHKTVLLLTERDERMSDNLAIALNYIDKYGFDTEFIV